MFNANNNQALQLTLQGYSNSINTAQNNGVGNAIRNFNQTLGNAADGYYQREQAQRNIKATEAQTRGQELANEFNEKNMPTALEQENQKLRGMKLGNTYQDYVNEVKAGTKGTEIQATNATNKNITANKDLDTTTTNLKHDTYKTGYTMKDSKNNAITTEEQLNEAFKNGGGVKKYNEKTGKYDIPVLQNEAIRNFKQNQEAAQNKLAVQDQYRHGNYTQANLAQAQTFHSDIQKRQAEDSYASYSQSFDTSNALGQTPADRTTDSINGQVFMTDPNTGKQVATPAAIQGYSNQIANSNTNTNINSTNITAGREPIRMVAQKAAERLNYGNLTEEEEQKETEILRGTDPKLTQRLSASIAAATNILQNAEPFQDKDRLGYLIGNMTKYLGIPLTREQEQHFGRLNSAQSAILTDFATNSLKGTLSNQDMNLIAKQALSVWQSDAVSAGILTTILQKQKNHIDGLANGFNVHNPLKTMLPDEKKKYQSIVNALEALQATAPR